MLTPSKIIEIFVNVDDFCKEFADEIVKHQVEAVSHKVRNRKASLSDSELITILIAFHSGHFTNLKHFYLCCICAHYKDYFPGLVSYCIFRGKWPPHFGPKWPLDCLPGVVENAPRAYTNINNSFQPPLGY